MVVEPAVIPVTIPVLPIMATLGAELLHTPPVVVFDKAIVLPAQTVAMLTIGPRLGNAEFAALIPGIITYAPLPLNKVSPVALTTNFREPELREYGTLIIC